MSNKEIYRKTLGFSIRRLLWDVLTLLLFAGFATAGFFLGDKFMEDGGPIGLIIGAIVGIIIVALVLRFISYTYKAGQIAMMTRGITEGELPDNVIAEGKRTVKERFGTVAAYFAVTGVIKGIFNQIGRGITKVGQAIGGDAGGKVGYWFMTCGLEKCVAAFGATFLVLGILAVAVCMAVGLKTVREWLSALSEIEWSQMLGIGAGSGDSPDDSPAEKESPTSGFIPKFGCRSH